MEWFSLPDHLPMKKVQRFPVRQSQLGTQHRGGLTAGETVLLLGTGGVSIFALQFAVIRSQGDNYIQQ